MNKTLQLLSLAILSSSMLYSMEQDLQWKKINPSTVLKRQPTMSRAEFEALNNNPEAKEQHIKHYNHPNVDVSCSFSWAKSYFSCLPFVAGITTCAGIFVAGMIYDSRSMSLLSAVGKGAVYGFGAGCAWAWYPTYKEKEKHTPVINQSLDQRKTPTMHQYCVDDLQYINMTCKKTMPTTHCRRLRNSPITE